MPDTDPTLITTSSTGEGRKKCFFMICDSCFWCASSLEANPPKYPQATLCPVCEGTNVHAIPLASDTLKGTKILRHQVSMELGFLA